MKYWEPTYNGFNYDWKVVCVKCHEVLLVDDEIHEHSTYGSDVSQSVKLPYCDNKECLLYRVFQTGLRSDDIEPTQGDQHD